MSIFVQSNEANHEPEAEPFMEFRLTYDGPLYAIQRDTTGEQRLPHRENKHAIRLVFHQQLKRLWEITPFLKIGQRSGPEVLLLTSGTDAPIYDATSLAAKHSHYGFNFVPLVTADLNLICDLDILFLRPDRPGDLIWGGDIEDDKLITKVSVETDQLLQFPGPKDPAPVKLIITVRLRPYEMHLGNMQFG